MFWPRAKVPRARPGPEARGGGIMANVSDLGLGSMGSALAAALQRADHWLCVWNWTAAKVERFVHGGADGAPSAAEAIRSSPVASWCASTTIG